MNVNSKLLRWMRKISAKNNIELNKDFNNVITIKSPKSEWSSISSTSKEEKSNESDDSKRISKIKSRVLNKKENEKKSSDKDI